MIKNTYAAACGNERRQHEKVFQRNMRRTGDALTLCILLMAAGLMGGASLRHHALCGTGGHGGGFRGPPGRCCTCGRSSRRRCSRGTPSPTSRTVTYRWRGASSVPWTQSGASSMWREPRSTGTMCWGSPWGHRWAGLCVRLYQLTAGTVSGAGGCCGAGVAVHLPLRRRKGKKTEGSPTGRCMATNAGEKAPTESVQAAAMAEEVPTLPEKPASAEVSEPVKVPKPAVEIPKPEPVPEAPEPAAEVQRPAETGRRQTSGKRDEAVARHGGKRLRR